LSVGDEVKSVARDGAIVATPARGVREKQSLRQLTSRIPKGYGVEEMDWGRSLGKEAW